MINAAAKSKLHSVLSGDGSSLVPRTSYELHEREAVHAQKVRLHQRAQKGRDWNGAAANDNIAWPLATALIREGNTELLKAAMYYRKVHDTAKSEAMLGGSSVSLGDGVSIDQRQWIKPNGDIAYKGQRRVASDNPETTARRKSSTDSESQAMSEKAESGYTNVPKEWRGDEPVNNMIDAQRRLEQLRHIVGVLVEPLEMSVIDGCTYREIGNAVGIANKAGAEGAGRALIHTALIALRDEVKNVKRSDLT